jgi:hypothetical protein
MQRAKFTAPQEPTRRDTIGLRSTFHYDPMAPRATTPMMVGKHVVARRPLAGSVHTLYMIMDGNAVVGTSISVPNWGDCESAIAKHRLSASAITSQTITKAKRKPPTLRVKEVA